MVVLDSDRDAENSYSIYARERVCVNSFCDVRLCVKPHKIGEGKIELNLHVVCIEGERWDGRRGARLDREKRVAAGTETYFNALSQRVEPL